jgi:hypothetical protein
MNHPSFCRRERLHVVHSDKSYPKKRKKKKLLEKKTQQKEHEGIPQDIRLVPSA